MCFSFELIYESKRVLCFSLISVGFLFFIFYFFPLLENAEVTFNFITQKTYKLV